MSMEDIVAVDPLSLRQLLYWVTVLEEGSFTAAAPRLSVSQGNLSQQIAALERRVGGRLLDRTRSGVKLTALGRELELDARAALAAAARIQRRAGLVLQREQGHLEIASFSSMMAGGLLETLQEWHQKRPHISIRLRPFKDRTSLHRAVSGGIGDMGVGPRPNVWTGSVESLGWEALNLVLPPGLLAAAGEGPVALEQLANEPWVAYDRDNGLSHIVAEACHVAGFQPLVAVEVDNGSVASYLAAAGIGPALVPSREIPAELGSHTRPLAEPVAWEIAAFSRSEWDPLARDFIAVALAHRWPDKPSPR